MVKRESKGRIPSLAPYPFRKSDQPILVMKRGNARGAKELTEFDPCQIHSLSTLRPTKEHIV